MKYTVIKRNFCESIFDLEFKDPVENGYFYQGLLFFIKNNFK